MKKIISIFMALLMAFSLFTVSSSAKSVEPVSGELKIISQNVAGLPIPSMFSETKKVVPKDTVELAKILNQKDFDILNVQEDFNYHFLFSAFIDAPYKSVTSGGIPAGSGVNIFSKRPIYNEEQVAWDTLYGVFDGLQDELTPKGFLHCLIEIEKDVYIDFYDIHMDAGEEPGDLDAKLDNYRQLIEAIESRDNTDRAFVIAGDFNSRLFVYEPFELYEKLIQPLGAKDAWAEFYNGGDYFPQTREGAWQQWDSLDRIVYKDGKGVHFEVTDFGYEHFHGSEGQELSDHSCAYGTLSYVCTEEAKETGITKTTSHFSILTLIKRYIVGVVKDLLLFWKDRAKIPELFK